jgi:hypothetical protein
VARRLDAAAELYRRSAQAGAPCAIIANGGGECLTLSHP